MMDRTGGTRLAAQSAIHTLGDIDIELRNDDFAGLGVLFDCHRNTIDRTRTVAGQASGANFEVDIEDTAITKRQHILYSHRDAVGILNRVGLADHVGGSYRHPVEDGDQSLLYMLK